MELICSKCFSQYESGKICQKCNSDLIKVDTLLLPIVSRLNQRGYKTISCCSGHNDNHPQNKTYIKFKRGFEPTTLPENFRVSKDRESNTIIYRTLAKENLEKSIFKSIMDLFSWTLIL